MILERDVNSYCMQTPHEMVFVIYQDMCFQLFKITSQIIEYLILLLCDQLT